MADTFGLTLPTLIGGAVYETLHPFPPPRRILVGKGGDNMVEQWKQVVGHPDYEVSNLGNVKSVRRNRLLKPFPYSNYGHVHVSLCKNGKQKRGSVHRLVLLAFIGECPMGMECRHLDGNASNNKLSNLCWGTKKENVGDSIRHGRFIRGERSNLAKLNMRQVVRIRKLAKSMTHMAISKIYGVSRSTVSLIVKKQNWAWL